MPTVECNLNDCRNHIREICKSRRISVDGVDMVSARYAECECHDVKIAKGDGYLNHRKGVLKGQYFDPHTNQRLSSVIFMGGFIEILGTEDLRKHIGK